MNQSSFAFNPGHESLCPGSAYNTAAMNSRMFSAHEVDEEFIAVVWIGFLPTLRTNHLISSQYSFFTRECNFTLSPWSQCSIWLTFRFWGRAEADLAYIALMWKGNTFSRLKDAEWSKSRFKCLLQGPCGQLIWLQVLGKYHLNCPRVHTALTASLSQSYTWNSIAGSLNNSPQLTEG